MESVHVSLSLCALQVYHELLMKHRQQIWDLEQQQDSRVVDGLCDLWKVNDQSLNSVCLQSSSVFLMQFLCLQKLSTSWSKRLGELAKDVFLSSVPAQTKLPAEHCEKLWLDLEQELSAQLQQVECTTRQQLDDIRAELDTYEQVEILG